MRKPLGWLALACSIVIATCGSQAALAATTGQAVAPARTGVPSAEPAAGVNLDPKTGSDNGSTATDNAVEKVIADGMRYLGTPYEFGSDRSTDKTFDCSDFVKWIFDETLGTDLPGDSRGQGDYVEEKGDVVTDWHRLKRGDLMFFMSYRGASASDYKGIDKSKARITHVALYLGDGKMLQTYSVDSGGVRVDSIEGTSFEYRFLFGGSVL